LYSVPSLGGPDYTYGLYLMDFACRPTGDTRGADCGSLNRYAFWDQQFSYLRSLRSIGSGSYHGATLTGTKRWSTGDQVQFNYTLSKSIDLASQPERNQGEPNAVITNPWNRGQFRGVSDYDMRHMVNANWVVGIPVGSKARFGSGMNRAMDAVFGGWQLSGIMRVNSGLPTSVGNGRFWPTNWNLTGYATQTADVDAKTTRTGDGVSIFTDREKAFDAYSFTLPGEIGSRNRLRGDRLFNLDFGLGKRFQIIENHTLQFRWEVFNATNTTSFDASDISLSKGSSALFGLYNGTLNPPRVMQFALRYEF
jgi:hypothetical protein